MPSSTNTTTDEKLKVDTTATAYDFDVFPDDGDWVKATFTVKLDKSFSDYVSMLEHTTADEQFGDNAIAKVHPEIQAILDESGSDEAAIPMMYRKAKFRDTSLGGNDAINPLPQFNHDDDIIHPFLALNETDTESGMGRVYSEMIDDNQQILYLAFGVAKFSGLADFYNDAITPKLASLMSEGGFFSIESLGRLFGTAVGAVLIVPFLPIAVLIKLGGIFSGFTELKISRYYDFKNSMPLYYKFANTILQHIAVNLGFMEHDTGTIADGPLAGTNCDLFTMLLKKYRYMQMEELVEGLGEKSTIEEVIDKYFEVRENQTDLASSEGWWEKALGGLGAGIRESINYIGLRIEKTVGSGESISNSTTTSPIANNLNQRVKSTRESLFSMQNGNTGVGIIDGFIKGVTGIMKGATDMVGISDLASVVLGSSYLDIPDIWENSSYSTMNGSNFRMALRAPKGDRYSYFQNICVPLSVVLAGALPRATGQSSYTSPFLINAHCPGKFTINMGIIDSITITRGAEEHGWSHTGLPTCIDVDFTIKDLSPAIFLALNDTNFMNVFATNSAFQAYLSTLGGRSMADTLLWTRNIKRRWQFLKAMVTKVHLNPISIGMNLSYTKVGRILAAVYPGTMLPSRVDSKTQ